MTLNLLTIPSFTLRISKLSAFFACALIAGMILSGCSSGRPKPILSTFECNSDQISNIKLPKTRSDDPQVTKLTIGSQTVFATSLIECGVRDYVPTRATSRQLLSGFDQLVITSEGFADSQENPRKIYIMSGTAQIDSRPIEVVTASSRSGDCVTDSVFWQEIPNNQPLTSLKQTIMPIIGCVK